MTAQLPLGPSTWTDALPPTRSAALARIARVRPAAYARTRNHLDGAVTGLSPYLTHGLVTLREVLAGALPALAGPRAVHATIGAVETFVDRHYQQQIDHLQRHGGPEGLLPLLQRCQADERHHRDEALALAGPAVPRRLRAWCALVEAGSAAAVVLARRV